MDRFSVNEILRMTWGNLNPDEPVEYVRILMSIMRRSLRDLNLFTRLDLAVGRDPYRSDYEGLSTTTRDSPGKIFSASQRNPESGLKLTSPPTPLRTPDIPLGKGPFSPKQAVRLAAKNLRC
ncbi:hypothetical protein K493DRAFT_363665 [Basidiobolus meristosporus CBS 931.73]|uniref:Uncharacterized protein n=1 Tax=Basidiobolus meristosporus CBS 931.73 TaxID=1314790 RepID=A0A1Y1WT83_9FUNG|nr:hypothetical protein K493DRAFT_363665 [Basidiobolus meristosporus CBS 931.73]|eukprot:ORX76605.1 hypothetical protein K493DRAFT_363665 [Basidiobolus meristosporus CBS 931.73]